MFYRYTKAAFIFFTVIGLSGCASYLPYEQQIPVANYESNKTILVSVVDSRFPDSEKPNNFIGVYRRAFGIPVGQYVSDISPKEPNAELAFFLERRLIDGLSSGGIKGTIANINSVPSDNESENQLNKSLASRWLLIELQNWYFSTDMHFVTSFNFDTAYTVYVYDEVEGLIFKKSFKKRQVIKETSERHNDILRAYRDKLSEILNEKSIKEALL